MPPQRLLIGQTPLPWRGAVALHALQLAYRTELRVLDTLVHPLAWLAPPERDGWEGSPSLSFHAANVRQVSPSTHRQALSALLFLYEVLDLELPWLQEIGPIPTKRIPVVLTYEEVRQVLLLMDGVTGLLARLLYGTGMRLRDALSLRVKDLDFDRRVVIVREGKGGKDRVVMLPDGLRIALKEQLLYSRALWEADRQAGIRMV